MNSKNKWIELIKMQRKHKNSFFKINDDSPISLEDRDRFQGLEYFAPNYDFRFELDLRELKDKEPIEINDSSGNIRDMLIWGEFHFGINGIKCKLQAYKSRVGENRLFIPYRDKTNEIETYKNGRYIELYDTKHLTKEGKWILDFNYSTLPWCAFNENYACPLVPKSNWLDVEIRAGEKNYALSN